MSDNFLGEIRMFAGNFAPSGWALCDGQILPISQNTALFSLLGTNYGGNGLTNFGLPNLRGASPAGAGSGPGLTELSLGQEGGEVAVALQAGQMPTHTHLASGVSGAGTTPSPAGAVWAEERAELYGPAPATPLAMAPGALGAVGGGAAHNNLPPYLVVTFIIALQGIFPARP